MAEVEILAFLEFVGQDYLKHSRAGWEEGHAQQYHTYVILEGADFRGAVFFTFVASIGQDRELSGTDEGETCVDASNVSKQDGTQSSSGSDAGYPAFGSVNVVVDND